jgi:plastocyanin
MLNRREFLVAGGLALAGHLLPSSTRGREESPPLEEIAMRASRDGTRVWFEPRGLLIRPGTTVRWVVDRGVHTTTAYHPVNGDLPRRIPDRARPWDSGHLLEGGASFEITPRAPGVYDYFCRPHETAGMVGRLVVAPSSGAGSPGSGRGSTPGDGSGADTLPSAAAEGFPRVERILEQGRVSGAPP